MILLGLALAQAAAASAPPPAPADPLAALHGIVIDNIRQCPKPSPSTETVVCSKDRGFAEGYRLPKKDPRFETNAPILDALTAKVPQPPNACTSLGMVGSDGCTIDDYQRWRAWKRAQESRGGITIER